MKGGENGGRRMKNFEDMVLKWTLDDIMNENLFKDKVTYIPDRFTSVQEYLGSFIWPLIEEMRAELQHSLESISQAPHLTMIIMEEIRSSGGAVETYEMLIDRANDSGKTPQKQIELKPKDILILSTDAPNNLRDFHDGYLLALVRSTSGLGTSNTDVEQTFMDSLKVKLYVRCGHPFTVNSNNIQNIYYATYLSSMITSLRIWNALHRYLEDPKADLAILPKAIYANTKDCIEAFAEEKDDTEKFRNIHFMSHRLNCSQASAVIQAVNAVGDEQNSCIKLIQGPPGTGKTSMLVPLISALIHKGSRLLVCAPTNAAISEVAMRFLKVVTNPSGHCPNTSNFACIINMSDILLIGNEERFDPDGPFGDIFLTYRIKRLVRCFLPNTGWRHILTSLIDFLESADSEYENVKETQEVGLIGFAQYIRHRLKILTTTFYEYADTILYDLPGTLSGKRHLKFMIEAVKSFVNLTKQDNVNERVLRECFVCTDKVMKAVANSSGRLKKYMRSYKEQAKVLSWKRNECIKLLKEQLHSGMGIAQTYVSYESMERFCLSQAKLVFSTVVSSGKHCMSMAAPFECLIIDEAAQLTEAQSTIALQISGLRHAILIGDPNQLPATVISKISEQAGYGRSLFERLRGLGYPVHLLNTQYRMHPLISQFPNMEFYENRIMDGPNVKMQTYGNTYIESEMYGNYAFINVKYGKEEQDNFGKSKKNVVEATVVLRILSKLSKVCASRKGFKISVGVISPYTAQVLYLTNEITKNDKWRDNLDLEVKSVDGFQGGEKDIIIISTVRTKNIGFLSDCRRANVAITRARYFLWIVGNGSMLLRSKSIWEKITRDAIVRKCFIDPSIHDGIGKVIRHSKSELDQFQDLLNKDSVVFNNTLWKVICSNEFKESFIKVKGFSVRQQIINTILKLANGRHQTRKEGGSGNVGLINVYAISGLYLVWTTDVERGEDATQVLKIWNVLSPAEVPRLRKRLENVFVTYAPEYIERCKARILDRDGKTIPKRWKDDPTFVWYKSCKESEMAEPFQCDDNDQSKAKVMPDLCHLSQNFRTNTGITKLAQSVGEVLYQFFSFAVDELQPDTSLTYGEPPIILDSKEGKKPFTTIFGHGEDIGNGKYEFGAEQAILVPDDRHKVQVLEQVGKQCLVLTILECKGLEFQDVLLYNFFSMSPLGTKWTAVYNFMDHKGYNSEQTKYPKFHNSKHNLLCSELKHLYAAITRAKQRLWIYEDNPQYAKPMVDYWNKMGIIQSRCLDREMVETMYVASNSEDWKQKGIQMFNEKNYDMAIVCFERAGDVECSVREAAGIFLEMQKLDSAASCYIVLGDYIKAGLWGIKNFGDHFFEIIFPLMKQYKNFKEFVCACEETSSGNIFEGIVVSILQRNSEYLTLGQIGKLQVLLPFLPKNQVREYGKKIIERLPDKHYWNNELLWLRMHMPTDITMEDKRKLVESFGTALTSTFYDWTNQNDYISPPVFLLLLEKLLFLSYSCNHLSESLFLPRSFFVEFMTGEQGNLFCTWLPQAKCLLHCKETMEKIYGSICDMVSKLLINHKKDTFKWICASKMHKIFFSELALRLIIVLSLIYINSRGLFKNARAILSEIFKDKQIVQELPSKFKKEIPQMLGYYQNISSSIIHFSRTMRNVDNPLILIEFGAHSECALNYEDVIVLRRESIKTKETVLQTVFQEKCDTFVSSESHDVKYKENPMFNEKDILSSSSNNGISISEHISESVKAEENVPDNFDCAGDGQENKKVFSTSVCVSGNISEHRKDDSVEMQARISC